MTERGWRTLRQNVFIWRFDTAGLPSTGEAEGEGGVGGGEREVEE